MNRTATATLFDLFERMSKDSRHVMSFQKLIPSKTKHAGFMPLPRVQKKVEPDYLSEDIPDKFGLE